MSDGKIRYLIVYGENKPMRSYAEGVPKIRYFDSWKEANEFRMSLTEPELFQVIDEVEFVKRRHKGTLEMLKRDGD